jgi:hypothetical protein
VMAFLGDVSYLLAFYKQKELMDCFGCVEDRGRWQGDGSDDKSCRWNSVVEPPPTFI